MVYRGKGCAKCAGRGMKGRTAAFEILGMSDVMRELVLHRASGTQLMDQAEKEGMLTMRQAGIKKMMDGTTSPDEVLRVLYTEE